MNLKVMIPNPAHKAANYCIRTVTQNNETLIVGSGGFRGYAGYAAAYPIDWTGCIFVIFNFCPIVWNWIFGHRIIPCVPTWVQKQNTEHALMTEADTDSSLQLVLDQAMGLLSGEQQCWPTSMYSMLCYRRWKCIRRSSTAVTTSSEPSLSCGSNAGMLQWNHPRLHWTHIGYTACNASLYPNLSILLQVLVTLPVTTRHHCHARAFLFHCQTAKDTFGHQWEMSGCRHWRKRRQSNLSKSLTSLLYWTIQA